MSQTTGKTGLERRGKCLSISKQYSNFSGEKPCSWEQEMTGVPEREVRESNTETVTVEAMRFAELTEVTT